MFSGRGKIESLLLSETVHFPKLALVNLIGLARCSIQSLAVEPLITFPIRLQIVPPLDVETNSRWR